MSRIVTQDNLFSILNGYEQRLARIEQSIYQPRTAPLEFAAPGESPDVTLSRPAANTLSIIGKLTVSSDFTAEGNAYLGNSATDVVGFFGGAGSAQSTGWGNPASGAGFASTKAPLSSASTINDIRNYVATLANDLRSHNLIGA